VACVFLQAEDGIRDFHVTGVQTCALPILEIAKAGLTCETAVHICYGYGIKANTDWKKTLGEEWRHYEKTFPAIQKSSIEIVSLECHNGRVPLEVLSLLKGKKIMVGAIDVA